MFEQKNGWENTYLVSVYNLLLIYVNFSGK